MVRRYEFNSPYPTLVIILSPIVPLPDLAVEDGGVVVEVLFPESGVDLITDPDRHHHPDGGHLVVVEAEDILHRQDGSSGINAEYGIAKVGMPRSRSSSRSLSSRSSKSRSKSSYSTRSRSSSSSYSSPSRSRSRGRKRRTPPKRSPVRRRSPERRSRSPEVYTVHINNLSRNVTTSHVEELFGHFGKITKVDLIQDRRTGVFLGGAYVSYDKKESALKTIEYMNNGQFDGQEVRIQLTLPNTRNHSFSNRSPPRFSGGGRWGRGGGPFPRGGGGRFNNRSRSPPPPRRWSPRRGGGRRHSPSPRRGSPKRNSLPPRRTPPQDKPGDRSPRRKRSPSHSPSPASKRRRSDSR
eukprot:TRINITY_DN8520_c0_g1_i6.p1 TRINITY_DN8520_c0_g1~~TRINITY_DN8520_c0_g1_i6.p1  ORF type:complete len:352 (+),score=41.60 TRINITY_DN8520_c0_g1_i6:414-1469(+)